ncbi:MAG: PLP-dependent transferase, partial [Xanthomonadales bacterium]|nr:PLP-dependent transferase [Xanthomonadales bacterium]
MSNKDRSNSEWGDGTRCVWGGVEDYPEGVTVMPVFQGVTFAYNDLERWAAAGRGEVPGHIYSRNTNPTVDAFEKKMRVLEGAEDATSFATGMAAI